MNYDTYKDIIHRLIKFSTILNELVRSGMIMKLIEDQKCISEKSTFNPTLIVFEH